jgi:hypothetical protein
MRDGLSGMKGYLEDHFWLPVPESTGGHFLGGGAPGIAVYRFTTSSLDCRDTRDIEFLEDRYSASLGGPFLPCNARVCAQTARRHNAISRLQIPIQILFGGK